MPFALCSVIQVLAALCLQADVLGITYYVVTGEGKDPAHL